LHQLASSGWNAVNQFCGFYRYHPPGYDVKEDQRSEMGSGLLMVWTRELSHMNDKENKNKKGKIAL